MDESSAGGNSNIPTTHSNSSMNCKDFLYPEEQYDKDWALGLGQVCQEGSGPVYNRWDELIWLFP